jgi:hypothetical protein
MLLTQENKNIKNKKYIIKNLNTKTEKYKKFNTSQKYI